MHSSTFTAKIDLSLVEKLLSDLPQQGFEMTRPTYTIFSAKKKGVNCTLYESGNLVVQGKDMQEFIEFYLEPEILKGFQFTHPEATLNLTPHIGLDEAGKGDFFGPLCIGSVFAGGDDILKLHQMGVKDSKRFSDESILKLARKIRASYPYVVIRLFPQKYNELYGRFKNLNRLLGWAHAAALGDLSEKTQCKKAILDQFAEKHVVETALKQKRIDVELEQRVRGEEDLVVAAASILARAGFLEGLEKLSQEYGCVLPKGAATIVIDTGVKLVEKFGLEILDKVAKTHFKTRTDILSRLPQE
ncbi:MAG: rnhC [Parachlamydiales bacterium]|nr:rnhC [Parachlamydiales bacterium]